MMHLTVDIWFVTFHAISWPRTTFLSPKYFSWNHRKVLKCTTYLGDIIAKISNRGQNDPYWVFVVIKIHQYINPSLTKDFYTLVRSAVGQITTVHRHVNRYNFVGFEEFLTKLWKRLDKSNTQIWDVNYLWNVTWHRRCHRWRQKRHIFSMVSNSGCIYSCARAMNFSCFLSYLAQGSHSNYRQLRDIHEWPWNRKPCHGLRDCCHSCLCSSYSDEGHTWRSRKWQ